MRALAAAAAVALLLAPPAPARAEDAEVERPWHGRLPNPDSEGHGAARILDASTGKPIPGARLRAYTEDARPVVLRYADLLGAGVADEDGFAWAAFGAWIGDRHWAAHAPGYAASSEIGHRPPAAFRLERGREVTGRIFDAFGRPLPGVTLDAYDGTACPHAPSLVRAATDAEGRFTVRDADPQWNAWTVPPAGAAAESVGLGDLRDGHALRVGWTATGRVLDAEGEPIGGVIVRGGGFPRGPATVTGADGAFRLDGVVPGDALAFVHPRTQVPKEIVFPWWTDGVPLVVRLSLDDLVPRDATHTVGVRVLDGGAPVPGVGVRFTSRDDGWSYVVTTGPRDDLPSDVTLPPGTYDVASASPFDAVEVRPVAFAAKGEGTSQLDLVADLRPVVRVEGALDRAATLAVEGVGGLRRQRTINDEPGPGPPQTSRLPAGARAVVRVDADGPRFFPVGAVQDGFRRVEIALPPPHRIRLPEGASVWMFDRDGGVLVDFREVPGGIETHASGPTTLAVTWKDDVVAMPLDLPADRPLDVTLDPATASPHALPPATLVVGARGQPPEHVAIRTSSLEARRTGTLTVSGLVAEEVDYPAAVELSARDFQTTTVFVTGPGEHRAEWGTCALVLELVGPEGGPEPGWAAVDGQVHSERDGRIEVKGLEAGRRRVLVAPFLPDRVGKELILHLREGESRTRRVRFDARERARPRESEDR